MFLIFLAIGVIAVIAIPMLIVCILIRRNKNKGISEVTILD